MEPPRTVVIGIDGAHFELIEPWLEEGSLPNIARVIENGVSGDLESVLPPVTSPNWKAYSTGRNPGQFGIFWWENVDVEGRRVYYPSARKHQHPEFWEMIAERKPVGVLGVPTTHPPKSVDSFLVSGAPDGEETGFAQPPEVESVLREELDYRVTKRHRMTNDMDATAEEILELIDLRFRAAERLLEDHEVSFLQITTFYINTLHHYCWDEDYTRRGWEIIDERIGEFLSYDPNVVLMSDHGSNEIETVFNINTWLEREGYLRVDSTVAGVLQRLGITTDFLSELTTRLGVKEAVKRFTPKRLINQLPDSSGELSHGAKGENVDWERTEVLASGQGPVYITVDETSSRYEELRSELIRKLRNLTDHDGNPIADEVHRGEEVYSGEYLDEAPDLVIDQAKSVHIPGGVGQESVFMDPEQGGWRAENKRHGLFAAVGPDFGDGQVEGLSILDLAPTLLHLHGGTVPSSLDGSVRRDVFAEGSEVRSREPEVHEESATGVIDSDSAEQELQSRLEDLGYM